MLLHCVSRWNVYISLQFPVRFFFSRGHRVVVGIYKILTCIYSQTQIQVYIYNLLWATGLGLSFRPSSGPLSNLKFSQSEMINYKYNLMYGIPSTIIVIDAHIIIVGLKFELKYIKHIKNLIQNVIR